MAIDFKSIGEGFKDWKTSNLLLVSVIFLLTFFNEEVVKYLEQIRTEDKDPVVSVVDESKLINKALGDLMHVTASDRAYIFRFHNGQNYFDGSHKVRMSCEYEVVNLGIEPQALKLNNIPTSLFSWWIDECIHERMFYENVDSIPDVATRIALKAQGVVSIAVAPYFNEDNKLVALIGVDWVGKPANISDMLRNQGMDEDSWNRGQQKRKFIDYASSLGSLLSYGRK